MVTDKNTKQEILEEYKSLIADIKNKGLTVPQSAKGLNTKNTKTDILSAINTLLDALKDTTTKQPVASKTPTQEPKEPKIEVQTKTISKKEDDDLSYLNQEIIEKIQALDEAKALKKAEYDNILAIEQELIKFVNMINQNKNNGLIQVENQRVAKLQQEELINVMKTEADESNQEKLNTANDKLTQTNESIQADKETLIKSREVEEEAYNYKITKAQKEEDDAWSDEVAKREEGISQVLEEVSTLQTKIDESSSLVAELNAKIEEIPTLVEQAKLDGATAKEKELGKEYGYRTTMAKKDAEATIQSLNKQIENLKEDYNTIFAEKQSIQEKLDKAYQESHALYMQTVQSTGGVKILNNSDKN